MRLSVDEVRRCVLDVDGWRGRVSLVCLSVEGADGDQSHTGFG